MSNAESRTAMRSPGTALRTASMTSRMKRIRFSSDPP